MKRCAYCGRPFSPCIPSQRSCSGSCERMLPLLGELPQEPSLEPAPPPAPPTRAKVVRLPVATESDTGWRTCTHTGCGVDFRLERKPGRPPKKCPAHRKGGAA